VLILQILFLVSALAVLAVAVICYRHIRRHLRSMQTHGNRKKSETDATSRTDQS
jgi:cell division protein FtsL